MDKNKAFTLIEVIVSLALFAMVSVMLMSLLNFATSSTTETERAAEVVSNSSATKELLVKTISPSTSIEILNPISTNDLTGYINELNSSGKDDKEYIYLYSIDGVVYYRNPGIATTGKEIKTIATTDIDLGFEVSSNSDKMLNINMTFGTKEIEPYVADDMLSIAPLNFGRDEVIKDSRSNKSTPSNIIRFVSKEIIPEAAPETSNAPMIISATVKNVPITGSPDSNYDVPFYVSQEPKVIQLYNYKDLANKGDQIQTDDWIGSKPEIERSDWHFKNTVIKQSTFLNNSPDNKEVVFVYKGDTFIDSYGNKHTDGTPNGDGTNSIKWNIPKYTSTDQMQFAVATDEGAYTAYDFEVVNKITEPEIVRFEFLTEDNYQDKNQHNKLPYKLKTYINQNDVYYTQKSGDTLIKGTSGGSQPAMYTDFKLGNDTIAETQDFYSTITIPVNKTRFGRGTDFYPNLGDMASFPSADTRYLNSRVATITFKGTGLIAPDGSRIPVPKSEVSKLNGVEEVSVKVTVDSGYTGDTSMLDGEKLATGYEYSAYIPTGYTKTDWFDPGDASGGKGPIFTAVNGGVTKRYTYQSEYNTTKPDYHQGNTADSGLNRVWVDGYMDGMWVGGSMRGDVSEDIVVKVPADKYNSIKDNVVLEASAYGKELVQLPSYPYGRYSIGTATNTTDNYSYYGLTSVDKSELALKKDSGSPDAAIRYNSEYLKHFVLLQNTNEYGPLVTYQVKVEKSYDKGVLEPEVVCVQINDNTATHTNKTFIKNDRTFIPTSGMETKYTPNQKLEANIAFAGSKIVIGNSINPNECTTEIKNDIIDKDSTDKDVYYYGKFENYAVGQDYFIHLYDYEGDWKEVYKITTKEPNTRSTVVYDLNEEMARPITNPSSTTQPFLPTKNIGQGASYGYQDVNALGLPNITETPIQLNSVVYKDKYLPVPYVTPGVISFLTNITGSTFNYASKNLAEYTLTGVDGKTVNNDWRMFIRSTRDDKDYINGGNNINTPSQYNLTNFMTPVTINKDIGSYLAQYLGIEAWKLNTDDWIGAGSIRTNFVPSNVKLDTTGFSVQIFNDRVYSQKIGTKTTTRSKGRPGTVTETNYDIALVDTTTDIFGTDTNGASSGNPSDSTKYTLPHDNSPTPTSIKTNDVLGYGFSLIEQNVDRDPSQDYLGSGTVAPAREDREVALMFYVRHFVAGGGSTGIDLAKIPGTYVKIADLTGFDMNINGNGDVLNSQAVNFVVDVQTTFNGNTPINANNYTDIMKNNYIWFTTTELDIEGNPTGGVHFKRYSFADVFGGVRVDDNYNELNLILNHIPRTINGDNSNRKTRLSVGYGTNWGLVGISDFKIMR